MEMILDRTLAHGMQGKVTVSHAFCLGMADRARARELVERLAEAHVAIATVATPSRPVPSAAELREAGVTLCAGSDGIRDTWGPYGNADMLERAMLLGLRNNFRADSDVEHALWCCTHGGAQVMGCRTTDWPKAVSPTWRWSRPRRSHTPSPHVRPASWSSSAVVSSLATAARWSRLRDGRPRADGRTGPLEYMHVARETCTREELSWRKRYPDHSDWAPARPIATLA